MTIANGQTVTAADLNNLYVSNLTKLRTFARVPESTYIWNYRFTDIGTGTITLAGGAKSLVQQTVEFTPPTDMNLKTLTFGVVSAAGSTDNFTCTITGSTLLSPITFTRSVGVSTLASTPTCAGIAYPAAGATGTAGLTITYNNIYHTFFAGATYKIVVVNTGLSTSNIVNVELATTNGFRR